MDGVTPGLVTGTATDAISGEHLILTAGGMDTHVHYICATAGLRRAVERHHHALGRRHRPGRRHQRRHHDQRAVEPRDDAALDRGSADQFRRLRQGQLHRQGAARRAARGWRRRLQDPRGLRHDPGGDPRLPDRRRRVRRIRRDPHRHAERVRICRGHDRRLRRPDDPHLPQRRRRRRSRAGPAQGRRPAQRPAELDQPDAPLRIELGGRAVRHDHGLPQPQPQDPLGRRFRRKPGPGRDDRRRERAARHGRDLDDRQRLAGDGPRRRDLPARDPDSRRHEEGAAVPCRRTPPATTTSGCCATSPRSRSIRAIDGRHRRCGGLDRARQDRRSGSLGAGLLRCKAEDGAQGRLHRLGQHGRPQRLAADAAADVLPADVRGFRFGAAKDLHHLRLAGRVRPQDRRTLRPPAQDRARVGGRVCSARRIWCATATCRTSRSTRRPLPSRSTGCTPP